LKDTQDGEEGASPNAGWGRCGTGRPGLEAEASEKKRVRRRRPTWESDDRGGGLAKVPTAEGNGELFWCRRPKRRKSNLFENGEQQMRPGS